MTLQDRKRVIATDVAGALVAEIAAERVAELNRVGLRQALERLALAHRREDLGSGSRLDVVRAEQDVDAARAAVVSGDEASRQDREALGLALGIAEPVGAAPGLNIDGLVKDTGTGCKLVGSVDERADLRVLRTEVDIAARGVKDVWYQFSPIVTFQSTLASSNDALAIPATTWNIEGVLTIPIWDGGARYGELRQASAQKDEAEMNLIAQRRTVIIQIEQARRAVDVAEESRKVAVDAETHARQVDRMTQVGFLTRRGTSLDLVVSAGALRQGLDQSGAAGFRSRPRADRRAPGTRRLSLVTGTAPRVHALWRCRTPLYGSTRGGRRRYATILAHVRQTSTRSMPNVRCHGRSGLGERRAGEALLGA